jgi:hypothetical protein
MIATDHFTFVHLHKCGGSFISQFLLRFFPSARRIGYHYPRTALPPDLRARPVLGCVRNPWDFYVSYYVFQIDVLTDARRRTAAMSAAELTAWMAEGNDPLNGVDVLFEEASSAGRADFATTTRALLRLGTDDRLLDRILRLMPVTLDRRDRSAACQREGFRGMNVRAGDLADIRGTGAGLYTFLFRHLYTEPRDPTFTEPRDPTFTEPRDPNFTEPRDHLYAKPRGISGEARDMSGEARDVDFVRMEWLREDLLAYLRRRGIPVTAEMERFVRDADPVNSSRHEPYPSYYDDALASLVRERDGGLAERFGYRFNMVAQPQ